MTDNGNHEGSTWPMPKFRFEVDFSKNLKGVAFQEVYGMDTETQIIEYRTGNSSQFQPVKMPGITKYGNVTMKRGIFVNNNTFWNWQAQIAMNTIKRQTVLIKLLDEAGAVTMQWTLNNAWPTKISSTDMKSDGNEVAVESLEIAYEVLVVNDAR